MKQVLNGKIDTCTQMLIFGSAKLQAPGAKGAVKKISTLAPTRNQGWNKKPMMAQISRIQQPK